MLKWKYCTGSIYHGIAMLESLILIHCGIVILWHIEYRTSTITITISVCKSLMPILYGIAMYIKYQLIRYQ